MTETATAGFELATWYDTWNQLGLDNLVNRKVPLIYATRYNLAFGALTAAPTGGYTIQMTGAYADAVRNRILSQGGPGVVVYAGLGDTGIKQTVCDNNQYQNRSTNNIVAWLRGNGYRGISIDAEDSSVTTGGMPYVAELVSQLGPSFQAAGLGIAVSAPWPSNGPLYLYGSNAVQVFNQYVAAVELQDYSSSGTPTDVPAWTGAGVNPGILMGGVCTENSNVQTSLPDTQAWTRYAMQNGLRGMFSWRLDNDHGTDGQNEDVNPTFTGAKTVYYTARGGNAE